VICIYEYEYSYYYKTQYNLLLIHLLHIAHILIWSTPSCLLDQDNQTEQTICLSITKRIAFAQNRKKLTAYVQQSTALNPTRFNAWVVQEILNANELIALPAFLNNGQTYWLYCRTTDHGSPWSLLSVSQNTLEDWLHDFRPCDFLITDIQEIILL